MEDQADYKTTQHDEPGQGHTKEQYRFSALLVGACFTGIILIGAAVGLVKLLKIIYNFF